MKAGWFAVTLRGMIDVRFEEIDHLAEQLTSPKINP